jgi:Ni/Co efflux regulator RcnB
MADGAFTMQSLMISRVKLVGVALLALAVSPAIAAPPLSNDDLRVGAPPVIVAPSVAKPMPPMPPRVVTAPVVVRPVPSVVAKPSPPLAVAAPPRAAVPQQAARALPQRPASQPAEQAAALPPMRDDQRGPGPRGAGYHRPEYGYRIPAEWTVPEYYISDFDNYGLSRPANGFGWSRYYDDAVLTDQWGRVYDWRDDVNWAEHDERYAGNRGGDYRDEGRSYRDDDKAHDRKPRGKKYDYKGRWTGSWDGGPEQTYQGEWRGTVRPHWSGGSYDNNNRGPSYSGNYGNSYRYDGGYDGGGTTVTTVIVQAAAPVVTTETISYDVVSYAPVRARVVHRYKPRPKPVCACGS